MAYESSIKYLPSFFIDYQFYDLSKNFENTINKIVTALKGLVTVGDTVESKTKKSKGYVFFSYAESENDFVEKLRFFMKKQGYAYWDYEESERDYHSHLYLEIEGVIKESSATLCVLSEAWKRSKWTVKEYFFSEEIENPVFLLRAKSIGPTLAIAGIPYIDFVDNMEAGFIKLNKELLRKKL